MRDPARIEPLMAKLANMWQRYVPDWRFGQLMSNFLGFVVSETHRDIFFYYTSYFLRSQYFFVIFEKNIRYSA